MHDVIRMEEKGENRGKAGHLVSILVRFSSLFQENKGMTYLLFIIQEKKDEEFEGEEYSCVKNKFCLTL